MQAIRFGGGSFSQETPKLTRVTHQQHGFGPLTSHETPSPPL